MLTGKYKIIFAFKKLDLTGGIGVGCVELVGLLY